MTASLDPIQSDRPNREWPSIAWFKLIDDLAEFDKASAYPCKWNKDESKWEPWQKFEQNIYSTIEHITGTTDDFVPCWHNGRVWEVISQGSQLLLCKTDASVTGGNSVTCSIWTGTPGSESDSNRNIEGCYLRYGYVPTTTFVSVGMHHGKPYILGDHRTVIVKADAAIAKGASGTCSIYNNEVDTTDNITANALGAAISSGKWATAWQEEKSGEWFVAPWECS